jgi:hypothetical protein
MKQMTIDIRTFPVELAKAVAVLPWRHSVGGNRRLGYAAALVGRRAR